MEYDVHVNAVEREVERLVVAAGRGLMTDRSPTCPAFDKRDLMVHIGEFIGLWTHLVCEGTGRAKTPYSELEDQDPAVWLGELGRHMVAEFRGTTSDQKMWTWHPDHQRVGFAARRACHELSIHRVDLELVGGSHGPVEADVASDGIDEVMFLAAHSASTGAGKNGSGQTMHLHGTDLDSAEWMVHLETDGLRVAREHGKGDVAVRASVSDLEMILYQRPTLGDVNYFGDETVVEAFHELFTFDDENED